MSTDTNMLHAPATCITDDVKYKKKYKELKAMLNQVEEVSDGPSGGNHDNVHICLVALSTSSSLFDPH